MPYALKIKRVEVVFDELEDATGLEVYTDLLEDGVVCGERVFGYPYSRSAEEITAELAQQEINLNAEKAQSTVELARNAQQLIAEETKRKLLS